MRPIAERLAERLIEVISSWPQAECVLVGEQAEEDVLDPYFALVLDVYHRGPVPRAEERRLAFGDPGAFETAALQTKDRFFLNGLPVRVEYKNLAAIEEILDRGAEVLWILKNSGTYLFYRLERGRVLLSRSDWIATIKRRLSSLPEEVWAGLRESFQSKMEHHLVDLGAAALQDDGFFYLDSAAGFSRYAAATLFAINRRFEPSHRLMDARLRELPVLPDDFFGRWDSFLREGGAESREQRHKIADLIARSIISLP